MIEKWKCVNASSKEFPIQNNPTLCNAVLKRKKKRKEEGEGEMIIRTKDRRGLSSIITPR